MIADPLLDPAGRPIIGHRGASGAAPENTLPAFDLALALGADALEMDVRVTADGVPVVIHDPTIDRTTDRRGAVVSMPFAELCRADAGARFTIDGSSHPFCGAGIMIPRLAEVLERYPTTPLLIELKVIEAGELVARALRAAGAQHRAVVASFRHEALAPLRSDEFLVGASRRDILRLASRAMAGVPAAPKGVRLYAIPKRYKGWLPMPIRRFIGAARAAGAPVHVWTVNDTASAERLWGFGASGMITNYPGKGGIGS